MNIDDIVKQYQEGNFKITEEERLLIIKNSMKYENKQNMDSYEALRMAIVDISMIRYKNTMATLDKNVSKEKETPSISKEAVRILGDTNYEYPRISINKDGSSFLTTRDNIILLIDIKTGEIKKTFVGHTQSVLFATFDYEERNIISVSQDNTIKKWNIENTRIVKEFVRDYGFLNHCEIAVSNNKKYLISAAPEFYEPGPILRLIDLENGNVINKFVGHLEHITALCFSYDNKKIVSSDRSNIKIWDIETGMEQSTIKNTNCDNSIMTNKKGTLILCGSNDCYFLIYDAERKKEKKYFDKHEDSVCTVSFNSDDSLILSGSVDNNIVLWDASKGKVLGIFKGHGADVVAVDFIPNTKMFISSSLDRTTRIWDYSSALPEDKNPAFSIFKGHRDAVRSAIFVYNEKKIISSSDDCSIILWNNIPPKKREGP
jgi:WD40 repeat protein